MGSYSSIPPSYSPLTSHEEIYKEFENETGTYTKVTVMVAANDGVILGSSDEPELGLAETSDSSITADSDLAAHAPRVKDSVSAVVASEVSEVQNDNIDAVVSRLSSRMSGKRMAQDNDEEPGHIITECTTESRKRRRPDDQDQPHESMFDATFTKSQWDSMVRDCNDKAASFKRSTFSRVFSATGKMRNCFAQEAIRLIESEIPAEKQQGVLRKFIHNKTFEKYSKPVSMFVDTGLTKSNWQQILTELSHDNIMIARAQFPKVFNESGTIRAEYCPHARSLIENSGYKDADKRTILNVLIGEKDSRELSSRKSQEEPRSRKRQQQEPTSGLPARFSGGENRLANGKSMHDLMTVGHDANSTESSPLVLSDSQSTGGVELERKLRLNSFKLSQKQKQLLDWVLGPIANRPIDKNYFNKDGQLTQRNIYSFLLCLQSSTGIYLINDTSMKEVYKTDERPSDRVFRSVDDKNLIFEYVGLGEQDDKCLSVVLHRTENPNSSTRAADSDSIITKGVHKGPQCPKGTSADSRCTSSTRKGKGLVSTCPAPWIAGGRQNENGTKVDQREGAEIQQEGGVQRHYLPSDFNYLDSKAVGEDFEKISRFALMTYSFNLRSHHPVGYKPLREYPELLLYKHWKGVQLPEVQILRDMLCTPKDTRLVDRVETLGLRNMSFPDVMDLMETYMMFQRLSKTVFFPDDHGCLDVLKGIIQDESDVDLSILRKKAIVQESTSENFKYLCTRLSSVWGLEIHSVLSFLMAKFKDDGLNENEYDEKVVEEERRKLLNSQLYLHARLEAESNDVEYFWPSPGDVLDNSKHESWSGTRTGVVNYTRRFGVRWTVYDGTKVVFLRALVVTRD